MKLNSALFSSLLILSISLIAMSADVEAAKPEKPERWFEIEVILFKQLGNKAALKEEFPEGINASNLPHYQQSFDLLTPYLQPNLTRIKQFIPTCGEKHEQHPFLDSQQSLSAHILDEIQPIEQVPVVNMPDFTQKASQENTEPETTQELRAKKEINSEEITAKADLVTFDFDLEKEALAKPMFSTDNLCIISQKAMASLFNAEQVANLNVDSFSVDALPGRLTATGIHQSNSPYLIADESLLLKDINQGVRWSKEFKPLLHFGWRQIGITKNKAIALKLFAGDHLEHKYQQALTTYHAEIKEAKAIENNLLDQLTQAQNIRQNATQKLTKQTSQTLGFENDASLLNNRLADESSDNATILPVDHALKIKAAQKQQALNHLFSRIEYINNNPIANEALSELVNSIDQQSLDNILSNNQDEIIIDDPVLDRNSPPIKPLQPWFLDGFLKVHLDHYLYINADFNVFNQNKIKTLIDENKMDDVKLINFSQNRRVISGEIHYFDHPYIGMIVQIRRFDPTKPADEAVSQSIK